MSWNAVLIAGPTASGKSALAAAIAEQFHGVVINADSMQVYRELRILTARPSADDEARVPHLLYGHVPVRERYSAGRYLDDAARALGQARALGRLPIFCGGTGLYFRALTEGLSPIPPVPHAIRERLQLRLDAIGAEAFHAELAANDPDSASALQPGDRQRVLRAASVLEASGRPLRHWQQIAGAPVLSGEGIGRFVLAPERAVLRERIDSRFARMIEEGALEELRALGELDPALSAARALGVPQLLAHLRGELPLADAIAAGQGETRRYAKRQMTWFRRFMADWKWLKPDDSRQIISETLAAGA